MPGRVTHIQQQRPHPRQRDGLLAPCGERSNFLTSASASRQLSLSLSFSLWLSASGSSFPDAVMGNVSTSHHEVCTRSDRMTLEVMRPLLAVLSGHVGRHGQVLFIGSHL